MQSTRVPRGLTKCSDRVATVPRARRSRHAYPDEKGKNNVLCSKHAHAAGSHQVQKPCRDCPEGNKKQATFPDEQGKKGVLCAEHARTAGCYRVRNPCRDCPEDEKKEAALSRRIREERPLRGARACRGVSPSAETVSRLSRGQ